MKENQKIHHDLAYVIQKGMQEAGLSQGLNFTPNSMTFTLPGNAYLVISTLDAGSRLKYELQFLEEVK